MVEDDQLVRGAEASARGFRCRRGVSQTRGRQREQRRAVAATVACHRRFRSSGA